MATVTILLLFFLLLSVFPPVDQSRLRTFHLIKKKMNLNEARAACRTNYTDLVTVYSVEENAALTNMINMTGVEGAWIGLYRNQSSDKWSNGDNVTVSNLGGDCGTGPCCTAMKFDGQWESLNCTVGRNFMCYKQDASDVTFNFHLILENKTWSEAQSHCRKNYTDLVSIRDQNQNEKVKTEGMNSSTPFWIGLLRDDWEWTDGGRSTYRNWADGHPRSSSNCTRLRNGKWETVPCSNNQPAALCYRTLIHISNDRMTWEGALDYCKKDNRTHLLHIESESDQKEVEFELRRKNVSGLVWLGLGQSRLFGFWVWSNGIGAGPWTNWVNGGAPEPSLSHHCGAIDIDHGFKWSDKNCRSEFRALCEVKSP